MKKSLTRVAMTLIAANAALAIIILLGGRMGETGGQILGTSLLATATALLAMVLMPAVSDRRLGGVALVAVAAAAVGFVIVTIGIWSDASSDVGWRLAGTAYVVAVAGAIAALLAGLPITGRSSWVGSGTLIAVAAAAVMVVVGMWTEIDNEGYWRAFAVLAVLVAAGGLAVPILHRATRDSGRLEIAVTHCPFCGVAVGSQSATDVTCAACGNRFTVTLHAEELSHLTRRVS